MIQRCFDDNNDDDKGDDKKLKDQRTTQVNQRTSTVNKEQVKSSRIKKNSRIKNQEKAIQESRKSFIKISMKWFFQKLSST